MEVEDLLRSPISADFKEPRLPAVNFQHIAGLTDDTGILQHAVFTMPNRKEGYCLDDNARALLLMVWASRDKSNRLPLRLLSVYLSFIHYMQTDDGYFRNFLSYTKTSAEERGSEDAFGRTMMALGFLIHEGSSYLPVMNAREMFAKAYPHVERLESLRGMANCIIGICQFIKSHHPDDLKTQMVVNLAGKMVRMYKDNCGSEWRWFEPVLTYDNAMLPLALLNAYEVTGIKEYLSVASEAMQFLESKVFHNGIFRPVGNDGWCKQGCETARFDQQGVEAMAMVLYYQQAFRLTRNREYLDRMYDCHRWFLGANDLGLPLYDPSTGGCADGLHAEGINFNQGAESTLAYWISHLTVADALAE